ncbi:MAG: M14 family metallopeptidase, partial [Balneolaceae bacterium]|nr:M14 family metallopeptidase [Balneolaceae bacterium]
IVGSEENLRNKEEIKNRLKKLTKRTEALPENEVDELTANTPSVLYIYVLDAANEMPGVEGSMQIAYDLATKEDPVTQKIRENLLVIMSPMPNPDAHAKNVEWHHVYNIPGSSVDPYSKQNRTPWGLRSDGNAWGIDINRDFTWFVTPETRAMAEVSVEWQPQTMLDLHCCPPVFFMTPTGPPDHPMWPEVNRKWANRSVDLAKMKFGERGYSMSSGMDYAGITYLGHGITWGLLGPSISGQMFESIGGKPAARRSDGSIVTLKMGIDRHIIGTWSVMETLSSNKQELLYDAYRQSVSSAEEAKSASVKGAVIPAARPDVDPAKLKRLLDRLSIQGIEVQKATEAFNVEGSPFMNTAEEREYEFPAGTYYVDFVQPYSRLARSVLDPTMKTPVPQIDPRNPREAPFYDSQVQNLPLLFGVKAYTIEEELPSVESEPYRNVLLNANITGTESESPYAYVLPAGYESSYRTAMELMQSDYKVRVFKGPFRNGDRVFEKGSFAIISSRNPESLHADILEHAEHYKAELVRIGTPINETGVDFGNSDLVAHIPNPHIAVLADEPADYGDIFAGIRTLLDIDFGITFSSVRKEIIENEDLSKYTAVILPTGRNYSGRLRLDNLKEYVKGGGTVIAAKDAGLALSQDSLLGKNIHSEGKADQTFGTILRAEWQTYNSPPPGHWVEWKPKIKVDRPLLSVGYGKEFAARGANVILYEVDEESDAQIIARYTEHTDDLLLDGFMVESDKEKIAGRPYVVDHPAGQGRVIYLTEPINYRGYWYGTNLLFLNALIFGPAQ